MKSLRPILVVEDSASDAELTLMALRASKVENPIVVTHDGAEALDYLQRRGTFQLREGHDPVAIFLDLKMPKVDGLEVLRQVKLDVKLRRIPVVMLTSSAEESDLTTSYELGTNAYVVKPVDFTEFSHTVGRLGLFWTSINRPPPR
jgi:CheY-like chemotaxis protein